MNSKHIFLAMIGLVVLMFGATIGLLVVGDSMLQSQTQKLTDLKVDDKSLQAQEAALIKAKKDIAKYADLETIAKAVVPQDKDQARAVREIIQIAKQSGINIKSITFPSSNLGNSPTTTTPPTTGGSTTPPVISQAQPVKGLPGVYSLEMTIIPETSPSHPITYYQFLDFLTRLENNRRTAQITSVKVDPTSADKNNPYISFSLIINIFLKP